MNFLAMPYAIGTVNAYKKVQESAATAPATARDNQKTDNMIRYKNSYIHEEYRSIYWKLLYIKHLSLQFH
jgi:hypothetical protein